MRTGSEWETLAACDPLGGKDMQYGYFDTQNREYVITRPDTPAPWANYLGSTEYGAIISGNAGG